MSLMSSQAPAREYATRPADERFPSLQALIDYSQEEKNLSRERTYNLRDLRAVTYDRTKDADVKCEPGQRAVLADVDLMLQSPKGPARFTHWSFGQLARTIGAPASYLRTLPPSIAADCLNYGMRDASPVGTSVNMLVRAPNGHPEPIIRACTSESYGRLWDVELYSSVARTITQQDSRWTTPPTWTGEPAGVYRSDRDSFVILVNGGSIVTDPSARGRATSASGHDSGEMYRGILLRNSEVGASAVVIETILLRAICGNHILWGATMDKQFRRRHFGNNVLRDTTREIARIAWNWTNASASRDEQIIKLMCEREIAHTKEAVIDELRALGASKDEATQAYALCEQSESVSPRSWWGAVQGLTRLSQETPYQDERYLLDRIAATTLAKAAKLVYA